MNLHEFMRGYDAKITQNAINSFKQQLLIHLDSVLGQISVVELPCWILYYRQKSKYLYEFAWFLAQLWGQNNIKCYLHV